MRGALMRGALVACRAVRGGSSQAVHVQPSPILALEHVNLNVKAWTPALERFWVDGLGFAKDPRAELVCWQTVAAGGQMKGLVWVNSGLQQVHMPLDEPEDPEQRVGGVVGLSFPDLEGLKRRLRGLGIQCTEDTEAEACEWFGPGILLESPTGLRLRAHGSSQGFGPPEAVAAGLGLPGGASLGNGIPYLELFCAAGAAAGICRFYRQTMGVPAVQRSGACVVPIGRQLLLFREVAKVPEYDGHHIAVYVGDITRRDCTKSFAAMYERCRAAGLTFYNNPRFPQFRYDTLEDAMRHNEFRVLELVDPETGREVYRLEHEVRSLNHPGFSCKSLLL